MKFSRQQKTTIGSKVRYSISISATPGSIPQTLQQNAFLEGPALQRKVLIFRLYSLLP
jgi:hypothetical protein